MEESGFQIADPERALAIAHAPAAVRPALTVLFALDERLGTIVANTTEPTIGLIRLAWWREALERLDSAGAPAEPLLRAIATELVPRGLSGTSIAWIEGGWAALLDGDDEAETVTRFARDRGGNLFALAAQLLDSVDPRLVAAGEIWSLVDLANRHSSPSIRAAAIRCAGERSTAIPATRWQRSARPLAALLTLARHDLATTTPRRQGAPVRLLRMLAMRLLGR